MLHAALSDEELLGAVYNTPGQRTALELELAARFIQVLDELARPPVDPLNVTTGKRVNVNMESGGHCDGDDT